ncbi:MAG: phosphate acyltransferase PlsX [Planctomycetota bacterium]
MRIALDVSGGDHAPDCNLEGAAAALPLLDGDDQIILVGDESRIRRWLSDKGMNDPRLVVVGSVDDIAMDDSPVDAVRAKSESSIVKMALTASRKASEPVDVVISAGNTGAFVSAAQMHMRRLPNVHRPGIAVAIPTYGGPVVLCDVGANPDPRAPHLWQYGVMGEVYARQILGVKAPRVAVLNIGSEEAKGTGLVKTTRGLLEATPGINFVGYIEGRALFEHAADVVVTDGFVGNVMLKLSEGLAAGLFRSIAREIQEVSPEMARPFGAVVKKIYAHHDYHEFGGAPLLGVNGTCLVCHGSSEARTITNAIKNSKAMIAHHLNEAIVDRLAKVSDEVHVA